nr:hypothetical protein 7 [bacterium]
MKKILFLLIAALFSVGAFSQTDKYNQTLIDSTDLAADTTIFGPFNYTYEWQIHIETWSLDAADAEFKIQVAPDSTYTFVDYADNSTITLDETTGGKAYEDYHFTAKYLRLITVPNSVTSGTYRVVMQRIKLR